MYRPTLQKHTVFQVCLLRRLRSMMRYHSIGSEKVSEWRSFRLGGHLGPMKSLHILSIWVHIFVHTHSVGLATGLDDCVQQQLIAPITSLQQNMFINALAISQTAALRCIVLGRRRYAHGIAASRDKIQDESSAHLRRIGQIAIVRRKRRTTDCTRRWRPLHLCRFGSSPMLLSTATTAITMTIIWDPSPFCQALLEEYHVAYTPGIDFEDPATGLGQVRFRISYAGGIATAAAACQRLHAIWPHWQGRVQNAKKKQKKKKKEDHSKTGQATSTTMAATIKGRRTTTTGKETE
jgi:hypothetical protein